MDQGLVSELRESLEKEGAVFRNRLKEIDIFQLEDKSGVETHNGTDGARGQAAHEQATTNRELGGTTRSLRERGWRNNPGSYKVVTKFSDSATPIEEGKNCSKNVQKIAKKAEKMLKIKKNLKNEKKIKIRKIEKIALLQDSGIILISLIYFCVEYDLVVNALARQPDLSFAEPLDLKLSKRNRIIGGYHGFMEQTICPNIFAAGDVLHASPRNEPAAAISGKRVAKYVKAQQENDQEALKALRDYKYRDTPYCLFTHPEIAGVGLNDLQAARYYGEDGFESLIMKKTLFLEKLVGMGLGLTELASTFSDRRIQNDFFKILFDRETDKVIGMHYLGDHASDVIQGYSVRIFEIFQFFDFFKIFVFLILSSPLSGSR